MKSEKVSNQFNFLLGSKISFGHTFKISKGGNIHIPLLVFAYGNSAIAIYILCFSICIHFKQKAVPPKVVGVITPYYNLFEQWKKDIGLSLYPKNVKFVIINDVQSLTGMRFSAIEKGYKNWEVNEYIHTAAKFRVR